MLTHGHPTDTELAAGLDAAVAHAIRCQRCRFRLDPPEIAAPDTRGDVLPEHGAPSRLVAVMAGHPDLEPAPVVGELWRLEFDGVAAPVVIAALGDEQATVWAVGEDPEFADAATLRLPPDVLGIDVGVWVTLEYTIPAVAMEGRLAQLPDDAISQLFDIRARLLAGDPPGGVGAPFVSDLDPRIRYREELSHPLSQLASCLVYEDEQEGSLRELLDSRGVRRRQLKEYFSPGDIEALGSDRLILNEDEVEFIAVAAESPSEYIAAIAPRPPQRLMIALHRPRRRAQLAEKAAHYGLPEVEERRRAARTVLASAKRTAGAGEPDWEAAIDSYLSSR